MVDRILVVGDPAVDWLSPGTKPSYGNGAALWSFPKGNAESLRLSAHPGGSALLTTLFRTLIPTVEVVGATLPKECLEKPNAGVATSWSIWRQRGEKPGEGPYRMDGWYACDHVNGGHKLCPSPDEPNPRLLVIEDTGLGFRNDPDSWPQMLRADRTPTFQEEILLRLTQYGNGSSGRNQLLKRLQETGLARRTTLVTSVTDLRTCGVSVGASLSWDRLFGEVVQAVRNKECPFVGADGRLAFRKVIVTVGAAGAVIVHETENTLVFDRQRQEGDFDPPSTGYVPGYALCMVAALAEALCAGNTKAPWWLEGTLAGTMLIRKLHAIGYTPSGKELVFPYADLHKALLDWKKPEPEEKDTESRAMQGIFSMENRPVGSAWSILEHRAKRSGEIPALARTIVSMGPEAALVDVPVETVGKWQSADHHEIEGVRSVRNAMRNYLHADTPSTPLSIAVFGPPGSGKSFAIKQIALDLKIREEAQLTFNLSQLQSADDLPGLFHRIRDLNLQGKLPLVFWDEFDTAYGNQPLGWLRYFLAPMQDGEFMEQGQTHRLGKAIFVFAGGTKSTFDQFRANGTSKEAAAEKAAKKPDFISRLRGFVDVAGTDSKPGDERLYQIRRAFLLHSQLKRHAPHLWDPKHQSFRISDQVMNAFLKVKNYTHGVRSMEALVLASSLSDKRSFELSSLPPEPILGMHCEKDSFLTQAFPNR